jgi:hypothetical protein
VSTPDRLFRRLVRLTRRQRIAEYSRRADLRLPLFDDPPPPARDPRRPIPPPPPPRRQSA